MNDEQEVHYFKKVEPWRVNKPLAALTIYLVGAWLTFGHGSTTMFRVSTPQGEALRVDWATAFVSALLWPFYWFFKSAALVFGG